MNNPPYGDSTPPWRVVASLWWRRGESNPRPGEPQPWLLRVCPAVYFSRTVRPASGLAIASPDDVSPLRCRDRGTGAIPLASPYPGPRALTRGTWLLIKQPGPIQNRRLVFSNSFTSYWSSTRTRTCNHSCRNRIAPPFIVSPGPHRHGLPSVYASFPFAGPQYARSPLYTLRYVNSRHHGFGCEARAPSRARRRAARAGGACRTCACREQGQARPWPFRL